MPLLESENLTKVINTRGTFTPLGVSRSSKNVQEAVGEALSSYFIIDELQDLASESISKFAGSEAATVTHCTASGITLAIAATMSGLSPERIQALPDTNGMANGVVIPANHCISYGHSILQAIRLSGAVPLVAGKEESCTLEDIERQIAENNTCCLLLVSSKLVEHNTINYTSAVGIAHKYGTPTIIDGAAQDFRIEELIQTGADLVLVSAQKYLAAPTAGMVVGKKAIVEAVRAQEKGIGRGMKATKEAIIGVLVAIRERESLDLKEWEKLQWLKVEDFVNRANALNGIIAYAEQDPTGLPFSRAHLRIDTKTAAIDAITLGSKLKSGSPSIWTIDQNAPKGELVFELVHTTQAELDTILERLSELLGKQAH